jgi:hypothetical protein
MHFTPFLNKLECLLSKLLTHPSLIFSGKARGEQDRVEQFKKRSSLSEEGVNYTIGSDISIKSLKRKT